MLEGGLDELRLREILLDYMITCVSRLLLSPDWRLSGQKVEVRVVLGRLWRLSPLLSLRGVVGLHLIQPLALAQVVGYSLYIYDHRIAHLVVRSHGLVAALKIALVNGARLVVLDSFALVLLLSQAQLSAVGASPVVLALKFIQLKVELLLALVGSGGGTHWHPLVSHVDIVCCHVEHLLRCLELRGHLVAILHLKVQVLSERPFNLERAPSFVVNNFRAFFKVSGSDTTFAV